jgi:uncharacterized protein (DUF2249 family)
MWEDQMNDVMIASGEAESEAVAAVVDHHAALAGALAAKVEDLVAAAEGSASRLEASRSGLVAWCESELVPHALAEEKAMYPAAAAKAEGRLLVEGMLAEHRVIVGLVREVAAAAQPVRAAAAARALLELFRGHLTKENDLVLPLLASASDVSVARLLAGMHELLGETPARPQGHGHGREQGYDEEQGDVHATAPEPDHGGGHTCTCGEVDGPGYPELDARAVPHAIRHATIFGALDAVRPGAGLVLVAPHDPLPLLAQVEQRAPGVFEVSYLERGPQAWRIAFVRRTAA